MHQIQQIDSQIPKKEKYDLLYKQVAAVVEGENDLIANLANTAALIYATFDDHWVGFYRLISDTLVLGPYQGPIACTRIPLGKGVCGTAAFKKETIIVPDVDLFPGHIACSSLSRSEIVVPLVVHGEVKLVLDLDNTQKNAYNLVDKCGLLQILSIFRHIFENNVVTLK